MARGPHLLRRGAVYYWQRRLPTHLANRLRISHVKVNLRTKDVATARRLVPPLDARAMEVFVDERADISREQLGSLFKAVLTEHQKKLGLLADLNRAEPQFERSELLEAELAQGHAYRLLSLHGAKARVGGAEELQLREGGHDASFAGKVREHIERLRDEGGIKLSRRRLVDHLEKTGASANAINVTVAQPVYLRALAEALLSAEERYGNQPISELDFAALMEEAKGRPSSLPTPDAAGEEAVSSVPASEAAVEAQNADDGTASGDITIVAQALAR